MKAISRIFAIIFCAILGSCGWLIDDVDQENKEQRDAYYTVIEAHALKQNWMFHYFELCSDNYADNQLFLYDPQAEEMDAFWEELVSLLDYEEAVTAAAAIIRNAQGQTSAIMETERLKSVAGLFDAMTGFYNWASGAGENSRKRINIVGSYLTAEEKKELYDVMLRSKWKDEFAGSDDFWTQLESGKLDKKAPQIFNDFYYGSAASDSNPFFSLAQDRGLTPAKIVVKEGAKGIEAGSAVLVETFKAATPLGKGIDVLETGQKWWEKTDKITSKPRAFIADEIKERISNKLDGFVDVDGFSDASGLGDVVGKAAKNLVNTVGFASNPENASIPGDNWGAVKVSSSDKSLVPEVIYAEQSGNNFPEIILGVGNFVNNLGETFIALPTGNWSFTALDNKGLSASLNNLAVDDYKLTSVELNDESIGEEVTDEQALPDSIQIALRTYTTVRLNLFDASSSNYVETWDITNRISGFSAPVAPINWNGGVFTCNFEIIREKSSEHTKFEVNIGGTVSLRKDTLFISGSGLKKTWIYNASDNVLKSYSELLYKAEDLEYGSIKFFNENSSFGAGRTDNSNEGILDEILEMDYSYERYNTEGDVVDRQSYSKASEIKNMDTFRIYFLK